MSSRKKIWSPEEQKTFQLIFDHDKETIEPEKTSAAPATTE